MSFLKVVVIDSLQAKTTCRVFNEIQNSVHYHTNIVVKYYTKNNGKNVNILQVEKGSNITEKMCSVGSLTFDLNT